MIPLTFKVAKQIESDYQNLIGQKLGESTYRYIISLPESINVGVILKIIYDGNFDRFKSTIKHTEENESYFAYIILEDEDGEVTQHDLVAIFSDLYPEFKNKYNLSSN